MPLFIVGVAHTHYHVSNLLYQSGVVRSQGKAIKNSHSIIVSQCLTRGLE